MNRQLARASHELKIPYIASGGIADGRGLAGALALGASVSSLRPIVMLHTLILTPYLFVKGVNMGQWASRSCFEGVTSIGC